MNTQGKRAREVEFKERKKEGRKGVSNEECNEGRMRGSEGESERY